MSRNKGDHCVPKKQRSQREKNDPETLSRRTQRKSLFSACLGACVGYKPSGRQWRDKRRDAPLSTVGSHPQDSAATGSQNGRGTLFSTLQMSQRRFFLLCYCPRRRAETDFFREQKTITRQGAFWSQSGHHRGATDADLRAWK